MKTRESSKAAAQRQSGFEEHLRNLHGKSNVTANSNQDATPAAGCMYSCTPILLKNYKVSSESLAGQHH
jgi:hypothetical protein